MKDNKSKNKYFLMQCHNKTIIKLTERTQQ